MLCPHTWLLLFVAISAVNGAGDVTVSPLTTSQQPSQSTGQQQQNSVGRRVSSSSTMRTSVDDDDDDDDDGNQTSSLSSSTICDCDIKIGDCDVDCCCDQDCEDDQIALFSSCISNNHTEEGDRYCVSSMLLSSVNLASHWLVDTSRTGLLCVVRDNLVVRHTHTQLQPVKTRADFNRLLSTSSGRRALYNWRNTADSGAIYSSDTDSGAIYTDLSPPASGVYNSGDSIWALVHGSLTHYTVPWSGLVVSTICDAVRPVQFLRSDQLKRCWRPSSSSVRHTSTPPLRAGPLYKNICLLANLSAEYDQTVSGVKCDTAYSTGAVPRYIAIQPYLCPDDDDDDLDRCSPGSDRAEGDVSGPSPSDADKVLVGYHLNILYRGGVLVQARVYFRVASVQSDNPSPLTASVRFINADRTITTAGLRSGPRGSGGYLADLPVLAAATISAPSGVDSMKLSSVGSVGVLTADRQHRGVCSPAAGKQIVFGVNVWSACWLDVLSPPSPSSSAGDDDECAQLQQDIVRLLLSGLPTESSFNLSRIRIATGGDIRHGGNDEHLWLSVITRLPGTQSFTQIRRGLCVGLFTHLHWHFAFSLTGPVTRPYPALVGVTAEFFPAVFATMEASVRATGRVKLVTSVTFSEVTRRPQPQFAVPPRIELRLPADFFYPFSLYSSSSGRFAPLQSLTLLPLCVYFCVL